MTATIKTQPDGFHTITPYLLVTDVSALIGFLKEALDGRPEEPIDRDGSTIRHAKVRIGDSSVMMGHAREGKAQPAMLYVYVKDCDHSYRRALAAGATSIMPPSDQFYGDRTAGVRDPSGNQWWLATHIEDVSLEEHKTRAANR